MSVRNRLSFFSGLTYLSVLSEQPLPSTNKSSRVFFQTYPSPPNEKGHTFRGVTVGTDSQSIFGNVGQRVSSEGCHDYQDIQAGARHRGVFGNAESGDGVWGKQPQSQANPDSPLERQENESQGRP